MILPNHFAAYSQAAGQTAALQPTDGTNPKGKTAGLVKTKKKRSADSKSLNAPYIKLTPILTDDDKDVEMDVDVEVIPTNKSGSNDLQDAVLHCMYCMDVGTYIWKCTSPTCKTLACVAMAEGDHGCINAMPDEVTNTVTVEESTFRCPQCYRAESLPVPYIINGYSVRQDYINRNYFPLLSVFLTWSGFGRDFASDIVQRTLQEHFRRTPSWFRIASRKLKSGNNRPSALNPDFNWLAEHHYRSNVLVFVDTHSDTATGDLVVAGNALNSNSVPIHELLHNYIGDNLRSTAQHIAVLNANPTTGPFIRGLVLSSCGSTGRVHDSVVRLKRFVEMNIFDFVFSFAGVSTIDLIVVPALNRFVENVFVYNMNLWNALQRSFGEDKRALNSSPILLCFAEYTTLADNTRQRVVHSRVLAYSNFRDGRPWGLDIYRCANTKCGATAHNMTFHPDGKQGYGQKWLKTKMKTKCLQCGDMRRKVSTPSWIHMSDGDNMSRVWYEWPLTAAQRMEIGITN